MEWFDYAEEDDVEGGVLEFDFRFELHVFQMRDASEARAVWLNEDGSYYRPVEMGQA